MKRPRDRFSTGAKVALLLSMFMAAGAANAQQGGSAPGRTIAADKARVIEHWTPERRALAKPRDLVIDARGLGYLRGWDGALEPYGHQVAPEDERGRSKPTAGPASDDGTPPSISNMDPAANATIGASHKFSAVVTDDASGVKSVSFVIQYPSGTTQSFNAGRENASDVWSVTLTGFTDGAWAWWVVAKDGARRGGNQASTELIPFEVSTGGGTGSGGGGGDPQDGTITNAEWTAGGAVQTAAGRIYFEMPNNAKRKGPWTGYVCSGTVVTDQTSGRSIILTAAHCVYDDANKAFARKVLFIPNQAGTSGSGTDLNCSNDPMGCWVPSFGVVDKNWAMRSFPDNIPWDYAYYVVSDSGAHEGTGANDDALDVAAGSLYISFGGPNVDDGTAGKDSDDFTHALGYSYSEDPNFMYCAEDMTTEGSANWWLPSCGLSGGSSGGPWVQPMDTSSGSGDVISVNSWGYTYSPGMAGPKLWGTSAACVLTTAENYEFSALAGTDGDEGVIADCP